MATQLTAFVAAGGKIEISGKTFAQEGKSSDGDISVATFKTPRATYQGVHCVNATVAGKPGAEVWSIIGTRRAVADFAIHEGRLYPLG